MYLCAECQAPVEVVVKEHPLRQLLRLTVCQEWSAPEPFIKRSCDHNGGILARGEAKVKAVGGLSGI